MFPLQNESTTLFSPRACPVRPPDSTCARWVTHPSVGPCTCFFGVDVDGPAGRVATLSTRRLTPSSPTSWSARGGARDAGSSPGAARAPGGWRNTSGNKESEPPPGLCTYVYVFSPRGWLGRSSPHNGGGATRKGWDGVRWDVTGRNGM